IIDHLCRVSNNHIQSEFAFSITIFSEVPIFAGLDMSIVGDVTVNNFLYRDIVYCGNDIKLIISYADIGEITEKNIIDHFGFTIYGLNAIRYMWGLKEQALLIEKSAMKGLAKDAFGSFNHLVDAFVQVIGKKKRDYEILKGRWGAIDGRKWTLEELGLHENLSRERIRQVEKKLMEVARKRRITDRLYRLWLALDDILATTGGVCCVYEIAIAFKKRWNWPILPADNPLASIINLSSDYELIWDKPIRIIKPKHRCVECSKIGPFLSTTLDSQPNGMISFEDAITQMRVFCQSQDCSEAPNIVSFSRGYLYFLEDALEEISTDGDTFYTSYAWEAQFGRRRKMLETEEIFKNVGRAMHFKEAHIEMNKGRPPHGQVSERVIYSRIERSPDLLLWDHGTFIHRDHISIPFDLIADIEAELIVRLDDNIPYLSVNKIFEKYQHELLSKGVQSECALYSCLRESSNPALSCPDYPFVLKSGQVERRQPVTLVLEAFVSEQGGVVTLEQIRKYALEKLCLNEAVFNASYLPDIPGLLRADRGMYIQISQLGFDKDALLPIVERLNVLLNASGHVSVDRLYEEKKISCRLLGISTPILLHSLIQLYYSEQYDLSRYPQIRLPDFNQDASRTAGVTLELSDYILGKDSPCSSVELYHHFVDKLGYKQNIVYAALYINRDILRYSKGVIIHLKTLQWTKDKQAALEMVAASHVENRAKTGKPFGLISHIYKHMIGKLPEIPEHIFWTATLIGELLSRGGKWRIIGTQRDAFVQISNSYGIENLDDLIYFILDTDYDGAANIDNFVSDMREAGVLMKSLTPMMLGADGKVVIDDKVVRLARLN
ncbi:MAG: hypothetical protein KJ587_19765, partial [Alphaproteobacteria bacterium]|nr:hypothetical protein [Alphaproteobacteria bacterium]